MTLARADQVLDRGYDSTPRAVVNKKSPGQLGLSHILCSFRKAHSTQHAFFKLLQSWQKELDNGGFVGTILMDLSKADHCIPRELLIAE